MMYIGKSQIDERGRLTLPKSFREANNIDKDSIAYFIPMINTSVGCKIEFCNGEKKNDSR